MARIGRLVMVSLLFSILVISGCSRAPKSIRKIVGASYKSTVELFIYRIGSDGEYFVEPPGRSSTVPPTVELYRAHPIDWMSHPESLRRGVSVTKNQIKVLGVLPVGTEIRVTRVRKAGSPIGELYMPQGTVSDPRFCDIRVEFFGLFEGLGGRFPDPRPDPRYLQAMRSGI
jgi:hypothetical protein